MPDTQMNARNWKDPQSVLQALRFVNGCLRLGASYTAVHRFDMRLQRCGNCLGQYCISSIGTTCGKILAISSHMIGCRTDERIAAVTNSTLA